MPIDEDVNKLVDKIAKDNISGANTLTRKAIEALILQIKKSSDNFIRDVENVFKLLLKSQPSMAPLIKGTGTIMYEILENFNKIPLGELKVRAIKKGEKFLEESDNAIKRIIEFFNGIIKTNSTIMTHSMSKTVFEILKYNKDKILRIIMTESRPQLEGVSLAKILTGKIPITLIVDSAIGYFIKNSKINLILVGADSILADGSVINKIGTYPLALLAHENKVPFFVAAESSKFNLKSHFGLEVKIEEKPSNEILSEKIPGIQPKNVYFDITPSYLITSIISEIGIFSPDQFIQKITSELQVDWLKKYLI